MSAVKILLINGFLCYTIKNPLFQKILKALLLTAVKPLKPVKPSPSVERRALIKSQGKAVLLEPVTIASGWGGSPIGELGLDGIADAVNDDAQRLGVPMPVVPCLLSSSRTFEGASILRVSSLGNGRGLTLTFTKLKIFNY